MKVPTLTSSRTLPTSQRTGFRQVAEEMDSAIGNVLQGLGAKLDEANKKQERTKALVDFSDWERETKQGLQNLRQTTTEDEPHYAERANSFITNQENRFEEKLPADLQDEFSIRSQFLGDSLRLSEGTHDLERKASYAQTQIQLDLEKRKQTVGEDHTTLQSEKLRLGELITNADTSDAAKALALREGSRQLT
ncbi:MAG: hypothetical protein GY938_27675, partial [Ketobacter sp.]|nr:hypothetical protein [Ketobacter sp.]